MPYGEPVQGGPLTSGWIHEQLMRYWPQLGTLLVRASVVREIGGFDVTLRRVRGVRVAAACRRPTCPHMAEGSDGMIAKETAHIKAGEGQ